MLMMVFGVGRLGASKPSVFLRASIIVPLRCLFAHDFLLPFPPILTISWFIYQKFCFGRISAPYFSKCHLSGHAEFVGTPVSPLKEKIESNFGG